MSDYPRPQQRRAEWQSLNGAWEYSFNTSDRPDKVRWQGEIQVPYPPESKLSGVNDQSYHPVIWYQRNFSVPKGWRKQRIILHFGAVDYAAKVWVNGQLVAEHEGGHTPFSADITNVLTTGQQTVVVRAEDDPMDMSKPRGKQEWQEKPHGIWYPRTTGIWQTVWLEPVSSSHISKIRLTPKFADFAFQTRVEIAGETKGLSLELSFHQGKTVLAQDSWQLSTNKIQRQIHLGVNGFDDLRKLMWSPENPALIEVSLKLKKGDEVLDAVESYTALRSVEARNGKFFLNNHPYFLRLALDQGYFDDSLLAAPNTEALKKDVELAKAMGFNGVRKHQKIEDPRYLYWADKLGLIVWEEMPSAYHFTEDTVQRLSKEWLEVLERDVNHPCIVAWVCFNESWGVPDLEHSALQRHFVAGLYHLTKSLDASRLVIGNDGWEHVETDLLTIHDYHRSAAKLAERYGTPEASWVTTQEVLEHGRAILLEDSVVSDQPIILSEFGGIRYNPHAEGWGYQQAETPEALIKTYSAMIAAISGAGLAGFCYTQFADTFQEQNGLLYSDRRPKVALEALANATLGRGG